MRPIAAIIVVEALRMVVAFTANVSAQTTKPAATTPRSPAPELTHVNPHPQVDATRALALRLPETKLQDVPLEEAIASLQNLSGANIHVNWRALETVNVARQTPITLRMQPLPLRKLLRYVLTEADGAGQATFCAEDGVIEVTTRELADRRLITKVYPVEDLLLTVPDFTDAPQFQLQSSGGGGGGGGAQQLFGTTGGGAQQSTPKSERGQELVRLVMQTVQPEVWRENGGTASIRFFRGRLIVTAPRSVHEQIGGTLE